MTSKSSHSRIHPDLKKIIKSRSKELGLSEVAASKDLADELLGYKKRKKQSDELIWDFRI